MGTEVGQVLLEPSECLILAISFRVASGLQIEGYQKMNVLPVHNIRCEVGGTTQAIRMARLWERGR
jgi:hypothetical protein